MERCPNERVTDLLLAWNNGDQGALDSLIPLVYDELHRIAKHHMGREAPGHSLQTTALVNEAYTRIVNLGRVRWENRAHFFALSSRLMRRILVDFARSRQYMKRAGNSPTVSLDEAPAVAPDKTADLLAVHEALEELSKTDPRKERVVELRFFGGLSIEETAEVLQVSPDTVQRDWRLAKIWLLKELSGRATHGH
jgi:RNA polymerase sigma factor (TIGR02999 family)